MAEEPAKENDKRPASAKSQTVRQKLEKTAAKDAKPRRLHKTARRASTPFRAIGKGARKLNKIKPFRILGFIIVPPYFRNSWRELRQVTWPNRRESFKLTFAVIIFAIIFGALVFIVDLGLDKLFKEVLIK